MKKYQLFLSFFIFSILFGYPVYAGNFIQWHTENAQILRGHHYEVGAEKRTLVTLEHANQWVYGDFFGFVDLIYPDGDDFTYYTELSPRFSFSKMSGKDVSFGPVKDVLVSTTFEKAKNRGPQYLYGLAVNLEIPTFRFATLNAYIHDDTQLDGTTWQATVAWNKPFHMGGLAFVTEGFADFQGEEGTSSENQLIVPRLLLDAGDALNLEKNKFYLGVEYQYWHNKFGIEGVTESVPQLQAKWIF